VAVASSPVTWVLVALIAAYVFRRRLQFSHRARETKFVGAVEPRLREADQRYAQLLARAGFVRAPHETDAELLLRLRAGATPEAARAAEHFVQVFQRERFRAPQSVLLDEPLRKLEIALRLNE
jgi:hypothetical protein